MYKLNKTHKKTVTDNIKKRKGMQNEKYLQSYQFQHRPQYDSI
jgi:hypothetical protein